MGGEIINKDTLVDRVCDLYNRIHGLERRLGDWESTLTQPLGEVILERGAGGDKIDGEGVDFWHNRAAANLKAYQSCQVQVFELRNKLDSIRKVVEMQ
jgi:hypothetical protein